MLNFSLKISLVIKKQKTRNQQLNMLMSENVPETVINLYYGEGLSIISLMKWLAEGN